MSYTRVENNADVASLAAGLTDETRDRPWVMISTAFGETEPEIVIGDVAADISDIA